MENYFEKYSMMKMLFISTGDVNVKKFCENIKKNCRSVFLILCLYIDLNQHNDDK